MLATVYAVFAFWAFLIFMIFYALFADYLSKLWVDFLFIVEDLRGLIADAVYWGCQDIREEKVWKRVEATNQANVLTRELIKALYCRDILKNPALTDSAFHYRLNELRKLEMLYPELKKWYSPVRYNSFMEQMAIDCYTAKEWFILKRTLDLTRNDPEFFKNMFGE